MFVFGRSMGSGPTTHLASVRQPASVILMSAFKSIRRIVEDQAGSVIKFLIKDRFDNLMRI